VVVLDVPPLAYRTPDNVGTIDRLSQRVADLPAHRHVGVFQQHQQPGKCLCPGGGPRRVDKPRSAFARGLRQIADQLKQLNPGNDVVIGRKRDQERQCRRRSRVHGPALVVDPLAQLIDCRMALVGIARCSHQVWHITRRAVRVPQ
jgi:hypothetical protein